MKESLGVLLDTIGSKKSVFGSMGGLAGHYCDLPIGIGVTLFSQGSFGSLLFEGVFYSDEALHHVMSFMEWSSDVIEFALTVNRRLKQAATTSSEVSYSTNDKLLIRDFLAGTQL